MEQVHVPSNRDVSEFHNGADMTPEGVDRAMVSSLLAEYQRST